MSGWEGQIGMFPDCDYVSNISPDLRKKLRVMFVNAQGLNEPGIDGGGVFREFLSEVLRTGFDPNRGHFSTTPDGQLYPSFQVDIPPFLMPCPLRTMNSHPVINESAPPISRSDL